MNNKCNLTRNLFKKILIFLLVILNFRFASAVEYIYATISKIEGNRISVTTQDRKKELVFDSSGVEVGKIKTNDGCKICLEDTGRIRLSLSDGQLLPSPKKLQFINLLKVLGYNPTELAVGGNSIVYKDSEKNIAIKIVMNMNQAKTEKLNSIALSNVQNISDKIIKPTLIKEYPTFCIFTMPLYKCDANKYLENSIYTFGLDNERIWAEDPINYRRKKLKFILDTIKPLIIDCLKFFKEFHAQGCYHLDFKLDNIGVNIKSGADIQFLITDFGTMVDRYNKFGGNPTITTCHTPIYTDYKNIKCGQYKDADLYSFGMSLYDIVSNCFNEPYIMPKTPIIFMDLYHNVHPLDRDIFIKNIVQVFRCTLAELELHCENYLSELVDPDKKHGLDIKQQILSYSNRDENTDLAEELYYFFDFIIRLTTPNMSERMNVQQALNHQFLNIKF